MRFALVFVLVFTAVPALAQSASDRAHMLDALRKPSKPMMLPMREGSGGAIHPMPARAFSITDGVDTAVTFLIVPDQASKATVANRYTLASGHSANYDCGQPTCYVRFAARGSIQAVPVARGRAYRFQFAGGRFDLYAVY